MGCTPTRSTATVAEVIDYALAQPGMYVVLNARHERQLKHNSRGEVLERLWQDIADIFRDRDHRLDLRPRP